MIDITVVLFDVFLDGQYGVTSMGADVILEDGYGI